MSNKDNPANDEEQSATMPTDYRALLAMTRPLVIAEHTLPSWRGGEICRSGFGIPLEPADWPTDSTLRTGEILRLDKSGLGITGNEGLAMGIEETSASCAPQVDDAAGSLIFPTRQMDSNLQIRIYLGMS